MTMMGDRSPPLLSLAIIADRLQYAGSDRERSVRRLFERHEIPIIRRGRGAYFATERQYAALLEAMTTCSHSGKGSTAKSSTSAVRSVSGARRESSQNILAEQIAAILQTPTDRGSKPKSAMKSFTVVAGGRTA
jgi:hypothetical protein